MCVTRCALLCRQALFSLLPATWEQGSRDRLPFDVVLAVNKLDVLPRTVSHGYVENFARRRFKEAGLPSPSQVHLVSCKRNLGVQKLLRSLADLVRFATPCSPLLTSRNQTQFSPLDIV